MHTCIQLLNFFFSVTQQCQRKRQGQGQGEIDRRISESSSWRRLKTSTSVEFDDINIHLKVVHITNKETCAFETIFVFSYFVFTSQQSPLGLFIIICQLKSK